MKTTGDSLRFWWFFTTATDGSAKSGLTPAVNVYRNTTASPISTGTATELGSTGLYYYDLSGSLTTTAGEYIATATTTDATVQSKALASLYIVTTRAGYLDTTVSSRAAAGASVTVSSPVAQSGDVEIRQGKDYSPVISTQIAWTLTNPPAITPTTVTFTCLELSISKACAYSSPTITLTLTAAETALYALGTYPFEVEAVISTLKTVLVEGDLVVKADI